MLLQTRSRKGHSIVGASLVSCLLLHAWSFFSFFFLFFHLLLFFSFRCLFRLLTLHPSQPCWTQDYFKHSEFYDRQCNNEQILMQQTTDMSKIAYVSYFPLPLLSACCVYIAIKSVPPPLLWLVYTSLFFNAGVLPVYSLMRGVEYEVDNSTADENYYVIRKLYRMSETETRLLSVYYVVGAGTNRGTVFPMPDIHAVISCNLVSLHVSCLFHCLIWYVNIYIYVAFFLYFLLHLSPPSPPHCSLTMSWRLLCECEPHNHLSTDHSYTLFRCCFRRIVAINTERRQVRRPSHSCNSYHFQGKGYDRGICRERENDARSFGEHYEIVLGALFVCVPLCITPPPHTLR